MLASALGAAAGFLSSALGAAAGLLASALVAAAGFLSSALAAAAGFLSSALGAAAAGLAVLSKFIGNTYFTPLTFLTVGIWKTLILGSLAARILTTTVSSSTWLTRASLALLPSKGTT